MTGTYPSVTSATLLRRFGLVGIAAGTTALLLSRLGLAIQLRWWPQPAPPMPIGRSFFYVPPLLAPGLTWVAIRSRRRYALLLVASGLAALWAMARLLYWWSAAERVLDDLAVGGSGVVPDGPWLEGLTVVFLGLTTLAALLAGIVLSLWPRPARTPVAEARPAPRNP